MNDKGSSPPPRPLVAAAILAAASLMLAVTGYSFGGGNHEVYLLEPLRRAGLATFGRDWFVHDTLQYHGLFAAVAATLFRLDVARGGFLVIFLILLLTTAWAWWRLVRALGGGVTAYLVAVVLYHLLLGDRGLGMYSLLQDGQFNAGNVAAVALLVGIVMWVEGRAIWSGVAFGVAGAFHLNYAVVAPGLWVALVLWNLKSRISNPESETGRPRLSRKLLLASTFALVPSVLNVASALPSKLRAEGTMPLPRFVELYVRLRHPHHYDPTAWPWWVWAAFLLPVAPAVLAWRARRATGCTHSDARNPCPVRATDDRTRHGFPAADGVQPVPREGGGRAWDEAAKVWLVLMGFQAFALLTAGLFWLGPTFVQLSLWRFSPHAKLLAVSAVAVWLAGPRARIEPLLRPFTLFLTPTLSLLMLGGAVIFSVKGVLSPPFQPAPDPAVLAAAAWAETYSPPDALFLLPPDASAFSVNARRGQVVSFKLVPQLAGELGEWDQRLRDVLDVPDLSIYAGGFTGYRTAQRKMRDRYDALPTQHLFKVAREYGARYVFRSTEDPAADAPVVWRGAGGAVLYDLGQTQ